MRRRSADFRQYHERCTRFTQTLHKGAPYPRRGDDAVPTAGGIRRTQRQGQKGRDTCGFPSSLDSYLSLSQSVWRRLPTCDRCETGVRQSGYRSVSFVKYSQFTDSVLLHIRATLRWVRHNSAARFVSALLRTVSAKINCTKRLIRRCRALQHAKELRGTVMPRLLEVADLCSSSVSDTANRLLKRTDSEGSSSVAEKKSSAVPLFRSRSHIGNLRQIRKQGKGRSSKRKGKPQVSLPFCPRGGCRNAPAVRRRRIPLLRFSEKPAARIG